MRRIIYWIREHVYFDWSWQGIGVERDMSRVSHPWGPDIRYRRTYILLGLVWARWEERSE